MLTGPQQMPVFSDQVLQPEDKRDIIAYLQGAGDTRRTRAASASAGSARSPRVCGAGWSASACWSAWRSGSAPRASRPRERRPNERREANLPAVKPEDEHGTVECWRSRSRTRASSRTNRGSPTSTRRRPTGSSARCRRMFGLAALLVAGLLCRVLRHPAGLDPRVRAAVRQREQPGHRPVPRPRAVPDRRRRDPVGQEADGRRPRSPRSGTPRTRRRSRTPRSSRPSRRARPSPASPAAS